MSISCVDELRARPWGGDRNLELRRVLVGLTGDVWDTAMVTRAGVIMASTVDEPAARSAADQLGGVATPTSAGRWLVVVSC